MAMSSNMKEAMDHLLSAIREDYLNWVGEAYRDSESTKEFVNGLSYSEGPKYIKVMSAHSVWGFVVKGRDSKFMEGDLLKAASWRGPARNAARGNILKGKYDIRWTGPLYL
jgi:hypothetical protein